MNGIILINKSQNKTSRQVVNEVGKKLKTKKVGHTGTLDPIATGVLVLTINKATKISELLVAYDKEYIAEVILGIETDTLDITGKVLKEQNIKLKKDKIEKVLKEMIGIYNQEVPAYSAVKIKGKKLYEYAREGKKIELPKRQVEIKELKLISDINYVNNKTIFKIKCLVSKGTYIRSLIRDIAQKLDTVGIMKNLIRTKQGKFNLKDCITIDQVSLDKIIPIEECLKDFYTVNVEEELFNKIKCGQVIENIYNQNQVVFKYKNKVISIYKKYDVNKLKPWKMLI